MVVPATAVFAAVGALPSCRVAIRPRNLLVITLDTMRADRLPPYGFSGLATHALDRLAAQGVVFDQAFAAVPLTLPSHASLFTGLHPPRLGVRDNAGAPLSAGFTTLAEILRERGLATAAFVASGVLAAGRGVDQGFGVYRDPSTDCGGASRARRPANEIVEDAMTWFSRHDSTPFFIWVHLFDTHRPYDLPAQYERLYADPYLAAIAFIDSQLLRLVDHLERGDRLEQTLIVIAGDHGESMGDHGEESHGIFVYQEALHVPLIVRGPGISPRRISAVTRLVDVMPTVLALFGATPPGGDGVSLAGLLNGTAPDPRLEVYAESMYPQRFGWSGLRSLRADRYKVIEAPRPELYDLAADPRERRNLFDERRALGTAMLDRLRTFEARPALRSEETAQADHALVDRLSSLGYVARTGKSASKTADSPGDPKDHIETFNRITTLQWQRARQMPPRQGNGRPCASSEQ
jgi:arylsulfatase A-like enzyme